MEEQVVQNNIKKIRTFAADYAAAKAGHQPTPTPVTLAEKPSTATNSIKIPHSETAALLNEVDAQLPAEKPQDSILTTTDDIFDIKNANSDTATGSIITDQKKRRTGVFATLQKSLTESLGRITHIFTPTTPVEQTVADPTTRTKTIQSAATQSALAPTDDHTVVTKRLQKTPRPQAKPSVTITKADAVAAPSWTHLDEATKDETEPTVATPTVTSATAVARAALLSAVETKGSRPETVVVKTPTPTPESASTLAEVPPPETTDVPAPPVPETTPELEEDIEPEPSTINPAPAATTPTRVYAPAPTTPTNNTIPFSLIAGVLVVAITLGLGTTWLLFGRDTTTPTTTATVIPSDIPVDRQIAVPITPNTDLLTELLTTAENQSSGIAQLYPAIAGAENVLPAAAADTLTAVAWRAPGNFTRAIERITFGTVAGVEQFIILKVSSFDVALSGMIAWESTMSSDLAPLFGPVVSTSFDPDARTIGQTRRAFFVDTLIANQDVRLLVDEVGTERIIYSLIDRETILITTSREAFINIAPRL